MRRTVLAFLTMTGLATAGPISFPRDIETIITRQGCNDNRCHGGVKGRGGLRLSPEMRDPRQDYRWIVKGGQYQVLTLEVKPPIVPRVNLKEPEKSLLLLKPTMSAPHGGGRRFKVDSPEYRTLLEWIRQGAPYGPDISAVKSLSVEPGELYLDAGQTGELKVFANRADGVREDVTARVRFETNLPEVARVTPDGVLEALKPGETAVVVHGLTQIATALVAVRGGHLEHYPALETRNYIDRFVQAKLRKLELVPSPPASDEEFLRRVCLDIAGTLPPPNRVREFLSSKDPAKRDKLISIVDAILHPCPAERAHIGELLVRAVPVDRAENQPSIRRVARDHDALRVARPVGVVVAQHRRHDRRIDGQPVGNGKGAATLFRQNQLDQQRVAVLRPTHAEAPILRRTGLLHAFGRRLSAL